MERLLMVTAALVILHVGPPATDSAVPPAQQIEATDLREKGEREALAPAKEVDPLLACKQRECLELEDLPAGIRERPD